MSSDTNHRFLKYNCSLSVFLSTLTILIPILYMVFAFMSFKIQTGHPPKMLHSPTDTYITLLQISDLHISNSDENALENFQTICELLPTLTPDAVVATGDLCHGRLDGTAPVPHKYLDDYLLYNSTVNECLNTYNVPWFDLKGNHDVDGVYGRDSPKNFVDDFLHSGIPALGAAYIDITKDGTTVRIIGTDSYVNAMINIDTTGFLSTKNLNDVFDYLDNNNEYNVLATHHPTSWITTEGGNTFAQMINNHFEDNNPIDISVCGHFHMDSMSAYHHGFKEAELSTLQNEAYRIIVLKDGLAHYTDVHFGDLAVVPLCPSDSVSSCQHTSIWVENNVDGVTVETNNGDELILTQIDEHLWQSTESINDGDGEKITVKITRQDTTTEMSFEFNNKYRNFSGVLMSMKLKVITMGLSIIVTIIISSRIVLGMLAKKIPILKSVPTIDLYSVLNFNVLLISLMAILISYFIPLLIGSSGFEDHGKDVKFYGGVNFGKVGVYSSYFVDDGYLLQMLFGITLWISLWSAAHFIKGKFWKAEFGVGALWIFLLGSDVFFVVWTTITTAFCSPLFYFQAICITLLEYMRFELLLKRNMQKKVDIDEVVAESNNQDQPCGDVDVVINDNDNVGVVIEPDDNVVDELNIKNDDISKEIPEETKNSNPESSSSSSSGSSRTTQSSNDNEKEDGDPPLH